MFTWISSRVAPGLALALALPLAACMGDGTEGGGGLFRSSDAGASGPPPFKQVSLFRGNVVVEGPRGYCIDRQSLRRGGDGGFVLIASCESLTGTIGKGVAPAVITVSVLPRNLSARPPSAAGLSALAAPAKTLKQEDGDGIALVQLSQGGNALLADGDPRYWRGGMLINGHVVGLAVYGPKGSSLANNEGRRVILRMAEILRDLSPVKDFTPAAAPVPPAQ
ncbi:hypothetical protein [Roseovarius sp. 2305UL8-3]|uniref:hypothetical protein n=1 Tax=Roseovarius conchicola TaxID=3121636 RepID=UPI00352959FC